MLGLNRLGVTALSRAVIADPPPPDGVPYMQSERSGETLQEALFAAVTIGLMLLQVALLAGPAIAVGARRNQHTLALLAASGADRRHLRAVVLGSAGVVGLVGCTAAAAAGIALGRLGMIALERSAPSSFPGTHLHLLDLTALVAVGTLTALAAAVLPARRAARVDVIAALRGRRGAPAPHVAVPLAGLVLAVAGGVVAVIGSGHRSSGAVLLGVAGSAVGLLLLSGGFVALAARAAHLLPLAPRLALRDAVRNRGRTAPAVAAVMAAIAGGVAITLFTAASDEKDRRDYVPFAVPGTAWVSLTQGLELGAGPVRTDRQEQLETVLRTVATGARRALPGTSAVPMRTGSGRPGVGAADPGDRVPRFCRGTGHSGAGHRAGDGSPLLAGAAARRGRRGRPAAGRRRERARRPHRIRRHGRTERARGRAGRRLRREAGVAGRPGPPQRSERHGGRPATHSAGRLAGSGLPGHARPAEPPWSAPFCRPLVAARAKLPVAVHYVLLTNPPASTAAEERATAAVVDTGLGFLDVEHGYRNNYAPGLVATTVAMVVIAFVGTVTAVGLALAEGRTEAIAYAAVGASPGLRRVSPLPRPASSRSSAGWPGSPEDSSSGTSWPTSAPSPSLPPGRRSDSATNCEGLAYLAALALGPVLMALAASFVFTRTTLPLPRRVNQ